MVKMDVFWPKWAIFDSFCPGMAKTRFFWEKAKMSLAATLCKKPEQSYERILRSRNNERTDERTDEREWIRRSQFRSAGDQKSKNEMSTIKLVQMQIFSQIGASWHLRIKRGLQLIRLAKSLDFHSISFTY